VACERKRHVASEADGNSIARSVEWKTVISDFMGEENSPSAVSPDCRCTPLIVGIRRGATAWHAPFDCNGRGDPMRLFVVFTSLLVVGSLCTPAPSSASTVMAHTTASACNAPLFLELRPGPVPGGMGLQNQTPARDIPPTPVVMHLPLYPTAAPSTEFIPNDVPLTIPPSYRKVAVDEFAIPVQLNIVLTWYQRNLVPCGFELSINSPVQQHGGPPYASLYFTSRDGLRSVTLTFRPVSPRLTLVRYLVQALDLPPRPAASFLHGPFVRVSVFYQSQGAVVAMDHVYRFVINWQPTITQLVRSINRPTGIAVCCWGGGGAVIMTEKAVLSFVRTDGGIRRVSVGGVYGGIVVGRTRRLDDTDSRVERLVDRLVHARCHPDHGCS
jgi:hypothetical protein